MTSQDNKPVCVMSRSNGLGKIAQGGRACHRRRYVGYYKVHRLRLTLIVDTEFARLRPTSNRDLEYAQDSGLTANSLFSFYDTFVSTMSTPLIPALFLLFLFLENIIKWL